MDYDLSVDLIQNPVTTKLYLTMSLTASGGWQISNWEPEGAPSTAYNYGASPFGGPYSGESASYKALKPSELQDRIDTGKNQVKIADFKYTSPNGNVYTLPIYELQETTPTGILTFGDILSSSVIDRVGLENW